MSEARQMDERGMDKEKRLADRIRRAYVEREAETKPKPFAAMWVDARAGRATDRSPVLGRGWGRPTLAFAASAAAVVWLISWMNRDDAGELDELTQALTTTVMWRSPTDELLELGADVEALSTVPTIDFPAPIPEWDEPEERS